MSSSNELTLETDYIPLSESNETVLSHGKAFFSFSPNMYDRYTVFSVLIGGFTYWTSFNSVHQTMVQRYLSLPNDKQAKL
jgi:hypothetical protein